MTALSLVNGQIVNEGRIVAADVLVRGERIERIGPGSVPAGTPVIDLAGRYLLPGIIDDQVHCREPGLTHKATLATESLAALSGGVTSFLDMPNTQPPTVDRAALVEKHRIAADTCHVNYGFYFGATNTNLEELKQVGPDLAAGIKVFMGASTGNMLVDDPVTLEGIFAAARLPIATHCEHSPTIWANEKRFRERYGDAVPIEAHPEIRSAEACYLSSSFAVGLAKKHGTRLHVLHLSTGRELELFEAGPIAGKRITAEVCVHHLWFEQSSYATLGARIKCNPAIKTAADRAALQQGVVNDRIDVIATDHAPHTLAEKARGYFEAPSGLPLVQHSLLMLLEQHAQGLYTLPKIVEKAAHNPATLFGIVDRGYVREGYFADLVAVDLKTPTRIDSAQVLYKCGWSPLEGTTLGSSVFLTVLNGSVVYRDGRPAGGPRAARPLQFRPRA
ncbi:MAG TPA: dihydroorotase [Gammaproteobacteria bacterium]|jgi:dihydroorotase|nr:dihydroorotase [Gammaproteobacteria bacterium]